MNYFSRKGSRTKLIMDIVKEAFIFHKVRTKIQLFNLSETLLTSIYCTKISHLSLTYCFQIYF
jgi:hypothetical protein